jgi:hypothetical protein
LDDETNNDVGDVCCHKTNNDVGDVCCHKTNNDVDNVCFHCSPNVHDYMGIVFDASMGQTSIKEEKIPPTMD